MANPADAGQDARSTVGSVLENLNLILTQLLGASRDCVDAVKLVQIANEMSAIQALINQAAQAQAAATDAIFKQATASLKTQSSMLQDMETHIAKIVDDANRAGLIAGYVAQALALIGKL